MTQSLLPVVQVESWLSVPGLVHGFLGRQGGGSSGCWRSLNLSASVGDEEAAVGGNWEVVGRHFPGLRFVQMRQIHGVCIRQVERETWDLPAADGTMTDVRGIGLVILTADCVPILMVAPEQQVVMALHAGWRGSLAGIAANAVASAGKMFGIDAGEWYAALGPAIDSCCYEVDLEIGMGFEKRWGAMPDAWSPGRRKGRLDLRQVNQRILQAVGVAPGKIVRVGPCTACAGADFFSHRASGGRAGRQASLIGWMAAPLE